MSGNLEAGVRAALFKRLPELLDRQGETFVICSVTNTGTKVNSHHVFVWVVQYSDKTKFAGHAMMNERNGNYFLRVLQTKEEGKKPSMVADVFCNGPLPESIAEPA